MIILNKPLIFPAFPTERTVISRQKQVAENFANARRVPENLNNKNMTQG